MTPQSAAQIDNSLGLSRAAAQVYKSVEDHGGGARGCQIPGVPILRSERESDVGKEAAGSRLRVAITSAETPIGGRSRGAVCTSNRKSSVSTRLTQFVLICPSLAT